MKRRKQRGIRGTTSRVVGKPLPNGVAPKEKLGGRKRIRLPALLINRAEGKTFAEALSEIRDKIHPENGRAKVSSNRKMNDGGVLVVVVPRTIDKCTLGEAVQLLLEEKVFGS